MTLRQAFTQWAAAPRNTVLAAKSRDAVQRVLMKRWGDIDLKDISETFARRILRESNKTLELQVKAVSILVHVLSWGGDHGYCQRPAFTYEIASEEWKARQQEGNNEKEQQEDKDSSNPETKQQPEQMEEKKQSVLQPRPVVQIAPDTLQVVKEWPSVNNAQYELGISNICRAVKTHSQAGGFYWCNPGEQDGFEPMKKKSAGGRPANPKPKKQSKGLAEQFHEECRRFEEAKEQNALRLATTSDPLSRYSDDELIAEMKRRGWKGNIQMTVAVEL